MRWARPASRAPATHFHLLLGGFDVCHHAWHVHAVPVQVLQEDVRIPPGKRASHNKAEQRVHRVHTDMPSCIPLTGAWSLSHI